MASAEQADRYRGTVATGYDSYRLRQPKWHREQEIMAELLKALPSNATLLDVPVGTGRFFEFYKALDVRPTGVDISNDMLAQARQKAGEVGLAITLAEGNILKLGYPDRTFDAAICIRLFNLIPLADVARAVSELARVSRRYVIVGARHFTPAAELSTRPISFLGQLLVKLRAKIRKGVLIVHSRPALIGALTGSGLKVARSVSVERSRNGTELVIYLLEKTSPR
jgi:ubiquinone/menaquinone biosynthesis C-methylase UbiE